MKYPTDSSILSRIVSALWVHSPVFTIDSYTRIEGEEHCALNRVSYIFNLYIILFIASLLSSVSVIMIVYYLI